MKKQLILFILPLLIAACSKSENNTPDQPLNLIGQIWYSEGKKSISNGMMYYDHLDFKSATDVDMYNSYLIGESTDIYTGHLKYTIKGNAIHIIGKDGFKHDVDATLIYNPTSYTIKWEAENETYTKFK